MNVITARDEAMYSPSWNNIKIKKLTNPIVSGETTK
jgi:hypothetical protein